MQIPVSLNKKTISWFVERLLLIAIAFLATVGFYRSVNTYIRQGFPIAHDLACYYVTANAIALGYSPYNKAEMDRSAADLGIKEYGEYVYSPFWGTILQPMRFLSQNQVKILWLIINLVLLLLSVLFIKKAIFNKIAFTISFLLFLMFPSIYETIIGGNVNIIILFLLLIFIHFEKSNNKNAIFSGIALGLAIGIKLYPVLFILLLLIYRRYFTILFSILTTLLTFLYGIVARGSINTTEFWFTNVLFSIPDKLVSYADLSTSAIVYRFFTGRTYPTYDGNILINSHIPSIIENPSLIPLVSYAIIGFIFVTTLLITVKYRNNKDSSPYVYILFLSMLLLIIPRVWDHYYVLSIPSIVFLFSSRNYWNRKYLYLAIFFLCLERFTTKFLLLFTSPLMTYFGYVAGILLWIAMILEHKSYISTQATGRSE